MKRILVRVRLPMSWPWDWLRFQGVGKLVTKHWSEQELEEYIIASLRRKGLEVEEVDLTADVPITPRHRGHKKEVTNVDQGNS